MRTHRQAVRTGDWSGTIRGLAPIATAVVDGFAGGQHGSAVSIAVAGGLRSIEGFGLAWTCHTDAMASPGKVELGYALSSEEHPPLALVAHARRAEESGFTFALVSDHFHPWIDAQGESPFVWSVLGGIAMQTERLRIGTGVTCPVGVSVS